MIRLGIFSILFSAQALFAFDSISVFSESNDAKVPDVPDVAMTLTPTDTVTPPLKFNLKEIGFGSRATGVMTCHYLTIQNTTLENISIKDIYATFNNISSKDMYIQSYASLPAEFTIPSPAKNMFPVNIQPRRSLTVSVCFTPKALKKYSEKLIIKTAVDSFVIPIWGQGVKPEEVDKLPKTNISVSSEKKGKEAKIEMLITSQSKVVLQIIDAVGTVVRSLYANELMNPGSYTDVFDGTEKGGKKLEPGTFYARFIAKDVNTNNEVKVTKMFTMK